MRSGVWIGGRFVPLKGLKIVTKPNDQQYFYRRVAGKLVPIRLQPRDEGFLEQWAEAGKQKPLPVRIDPRSVAALAISYQGSDSWNALAPSTREMRKRILDKIVADRGAAIVKGLLEEHIKKDLKGMKAGSANNRLRIWRVLLTHAVEEEWIDRNPAHQVLKRKTKVNPREPWWEEQVEMFRARWPIGTKQRLAFEILHWSGGRLSDAVEFGWQKVRDGWLHYFQKKTGGPCTCPITDQLPGYLSHFEADRQMLLACLDAAKDNMMWILTDYGRPRSEKAISNWFSEACDDAKLDGYTAHGLRKTRAIFMAEAGASTHQIGAWVGHEDLKEIKRYTRGARQRKIIEGTSEEQELETGPRRFPKSRNSSTKSG
jgi:integrase/recombinase XerD